MTDPSTQDLSESADQAQSRVISVLLVDDDPAFRHLCKRLLRQEADCSYEVHEASSAAEASLAYADNNFDCVLIDYRLPDASGTKLMRTLQPEYQPRVPMIMLTAAGSEEVAADALHAGAVDYLPKQSASSHALRRAIRNAVEKARLHRSIEERNRKLEEANQQLKNKNDEIRRFYHTVSHEIKTPLTAAREFVALVADGLIGETNEQQREILSHALDSCDQIAEHFHDLVESARLETGKLTLKRRLEGIERSIQRSVASVSPALSARGVRLEQNLAGDLPCLNIDAGRIVQVISNLLSNAVKFTDAGGTISLNVSKLEDPAAMVEISVSDTGCGIEAEHLPRIFDRLYQAERRDDTMNGAGLGLGLSIAREIVLLHGGEIKVESEVGKGTTFRIHLPMPSMEPDTTREARII